MSRLVIVLTKIKKAERGRNIIFGRIFP